MAIQFVRFTEAYKQEPIWIIPEQMIFAEVVEQKDTKTKHVLGQMTVMHLAGKDAKIFIKELPEEINRILSKLEDNAKAIELRKQLRALGVEGVKQAQPVTPAKPTK
jgi:hypothetical protein